MLVITTLTQNTHLLSHTLRFPQKHTVRCVEESVCVCVCVWRRVCETCVSRVINVMGIIFECVFVCVGVVLLCVGVCHPIPLFHVFFPSFSLPPHSLLIFSINFRFITLAHTHTHTHKHKHTHTYIHTHTFTDTHTCAHTNT